MTMTPTATVRRFAANYQRMIRFAIVGAINTAIDFSIFTVLYYRLAVWVVPANICSYGVAVTNSYLMHRYWTFADRGERRPSARQFLVFLSFNLVGLSISTVTVWLLTAVMPALLAKTCAIFATFVWNYWSSRTFVYRS